MDTTDALVLVIARNSFYKRLHYLVFAALVIAMIVIIILFGILVHLFRYPTQPLYFATDEVGRLIPVVAVDQPNMSNDEVMKWTTNAIENTLTYNFINFRERLQGAQRYFTDYGWRTYMDALTATNNLVALQSRKMVFIGQVIDKPKLVTEGILSGSYAWKFNFPVLMTYMTPPYDAQSTFTNPLQISIVIQRGPILQTYQGLGILQIIANIVIAPPQQPQQQLTPTAPTAPPPAP